MKTTATLTLQLVRRHLADPARIRHFEEYDNHSVDIRPATRITPAAAAFLADNFGGYLNLDDITQLTPATARALARFDGQLCLNGVRELSAACARALAKHKGELWLNGLIHLKAGAAKKGSGRNLQRCGPPKGSLPKESGRNLQQRAGRSIPR
jgi:hypothetical protein